MKFILHLSFLSILLCFYSCLQPGADPYHGPLLPVSISGSGNFGFLLDGEVWVPDGPSIVYREVDNFTFPISMSTHTTASDATQFASSQVMIDAIIESDLSCRLTNFYFFDDDGCDFTDDYDWNKTHVNIIHLDVDSSIISGVFSLGMIDFDCGKKREISKGRFDLQF